MILDIAIYIFVAMELSNMLIMYFKPDFKYGNSMSVFKAWKQSKQTEGEYLFAGYMVRWVANCKLVFITLLLSIALLGNDEIKLLGVVVTIFSIGVYFITLYPLIRRLDKLGEIQPAGYSTRLSAMIGGFMALFTLALILHLILKI